ncbi:MULTISPECIES: methyltransferase domain-containing protein [Paenibacillus]|uniref:Methyltransferase domain-containing protein n=1 Tax=Paenibacillus residui TaxID=629724 RepID=A0ABW3D7U3_9BACL
MSEYYWDNKVDYLSNTRGLYYNDDYLEFLVGTVWKINAPVNVIDFGYGYGYLGLKLLPLLPEGSSYTGLDRGEELIRTAREVFRTLPYSARFIAGDLEELQVERKYDIAVCHAFLLHMTEPKKMLRKMIDSVVDEGRVICFEPHWITGMAGYHLEGADSSRIIPLDILQKLYEKDGARTGKDGNIGIKLPIYMSQLGLRNVQCRVSDKVNFLDQTMEQPDKEDLFRSIQADGFAAKPGNQEQFVRSLEKRGLTPEEARRQYEAEVLLSGLFNMDSYLAYAPAMKISFGTVRR